MTSSFNINKADLEFILKQIQLAESTSIGYTAAPVSIQQAIINTHNLSASDAAIAPFGLRTVDGTYNNILVEANKNLGAADTLFPRLTDPVYLNELDEGAGFNGVTNTNYGTGGSVVDSDPRAISNLIVDMSVNNPAVIQAFLNNPLSVAYYMETHNGTPPTALNLTNEDLQVLPNQSPDIGLSPGFNSWMTFFGQFFDHGLDLVTKGNNGTVYIPLQADDPLIAGADGILLDDPGTLLVDESADNLPAHLQFMALTRATPTYVNGVAQYENTTTSFIDQNQTYTSNASHQVFLREYVKVDLDGPSGNGPVAVSTGKLLDGAVAGAIANWGEVKAQALTMLGIKLDDFDVHNAPLLKTDQYGKFIPGVNGYAQLVMAPDATHLTNWFKEGTATGITTVGSIGTGHAFLNDIAHHAAPGLWDDDGNPATAKVRQTADLDPGTGDDLNPGTYDDEMLNAHFITGDGRGNENIALTSVHSIFHSEHNRMVEANKETILQSNNLAFLNDWLLVDAAALPTTPAELNALKWDGERLFQAARFTTEMQYQHLVFEEFVRRIQPQVNPFVFNNSPNVDPSIVAEFAHTVYRFGHSMLSGTVDRLENDLTAINEGANTNPDQKTLVAMFLNPQAYLASGTTAAEINANLVRGLSQDVGNEIDEFIVTDVRSNLLGLPLDLGALNIARGRETGVPSLNETRRQLYGNTGLSDLKPYTSWSDFELNIKNIDSVVNFIAAYGTHLTVTTATTFADKRAAAASIVAAAREADDLIDMGEPVSTLGAVKLEKIDFWNATGSHSGGNLGGLNNVDLWIGGLAEARPEFGGMLGTTFNYVFEAQMENLQNGDRMYYLSRTQGTNILNQLEPNTFTDLVMRNTELGSNYSTHLNANLFTTPDLILELDRGIAQTDYNGAAFGNDPQSQVLRNYSSSTVVDGNHDVGGFLRFRGGEHVVLGGTEGNDTLLGDKGIDALWGDGGNDYLNAGTESDNVFGGDGDDVIEDPFGDDLLRGNLGNDVISSDRGVDILFGDQGKDYLVVGQDAGEVFGGQDDDFILGGSGGDALMGNEGDDWIEGGDGFDGLTGENSELFFNSPIIGHDVLFGQGDETDYDAESGDDIMGSAGGTVVRYNGMFGFDWGIAKNDPNGVNFDLTPFLGVAPPPKILRDRFDLVEAASGWRYDDHLDGDDRDGLILPGSVQSFNDHILTAEGIARITNLGNLVNPAITTYGLANGAFRNGNILLGGDGNDFLRGKGGNDILDGDAYLNVRIKIVIPTGVNAGIYSAESLSTDKHVAGEYAGRVYNTNPDGSPNFGSVAFGGRSITSLMLDRTINPGQMSIVREILDGTDALNETDDDTAIFQGTYDEYTIEGRVTTGLNGSGTVTRTAFDLNNDGFISVIDTITTRAVSDGHDLLKNIELLQFSDPTLGNPNQTLTIRIGGQLAPTHIRSADFNGDGISDLLWRNTYSGEAYTYRMNGLAVAAESSLRIVSNDWKVSGTGDFNGDNKDDILWRNANSGEAYIYQMDGLAVANEGSLRTINSDWKFSSTGDFNGDNKDDILWRNANSGEVYIYQMNGLAVAAEGSVTTLGTVGPDWKISGTGDFNGDGKSDMLWRNANTGGTYIYLMDGISVAAEGAVQPVPNNLVIRGIDDFNGDGKDDILWRNTNNGDTYIYQMNGLTVAAEDMIGQTTSNDHKQSYWSITGTGDYNGDGNADILWRHTNGTAYAWNMNGSNLLGEGAIRQVDSSWQVAAPTI
jgi:Ca2+-binding RTX toxin-like protein